MFHSRLLWKLYLVSVALILLTSLVIGSLLGRQILTDGRQQVQRYLESSATIVKTLLAQTQQVKSDNLQSQLAVLGRDLTTRFTIVEADGRVIADSHREPEAMENHADRPEIRQALRESEGYANRYSNTIGQDMLYYAIAIKDSPGKALIVRTSLPLTEVHDHLSHLQLIVALATSVAVFGALILGFIFTRRITEPIGALTKTAETIAHGGELDMRLDVKRSDEIGAMAAAFNRMADRLSLRMQSAMAERNKLQSILSSMVEGVLAIDSEEQVLHLNEAGCVLFGIERSQSTGQKVWDICRIAEVNESLRKVLEHGKASEDEITHSHARGIMHIGIHCDAIHDADGATIGAVAVLHDLTDIRKLESMRRDFIANVSHELKTPLTAIIGIVETIIDDPDMPKNIRTDFLGRVSKQADRLSQLIVDLLTLSRLESPDAGMDGLPVNLVDIAQASCNHLQQTASDQEVAIQFEPDERALYITGDNEFLRQAVDNLIDNALKYTPAGGTVTVSCQREDTFIRFAVTDTGIGITKSDQERIFERFYRVDKARSRSLGGTGLGLAIVKHIALSHGGQIVVDSVPGKGSTFALLLPAVSR